jgi:hypothetical protein
MNVIVEKRLAELGSRRRSVWSAFQQRTSRELRAVPEAIRWLFGIGK